MQVKAPKTLITRVSLFGRKNMKAGLRGNTAATSIYLQNLTLFSAPRGTNNPLSGALKGCLGSLDAACIEKLLLHCASALENNDVTLAQQVMWVLNNVASTAGDPNQRLTSWFLKALIARAAKLCPTSSLNFNGGVEAPRRLMSVTELAVYVDLIPWHRFGFSVSNSVILRAIEGYSKVHILDFSITHCMQWPTLIDALAKRPEGPPSLKITIPSCQPNVPPFLNVFNEEIGFRLGNFAKFRDVPFEFSILGNDESLWDEALRNYKEPSSIGFQFDALLSQLNSANLQLKDNEALIINCQNWLRHLSDEPDEVNIQDNSPRDAFLEIIKGLDPHVVIVVDEDVDLSASSLAARITTCFNYLWIPFDALETFLPKDSHQRIDYESDIGHKIENIIVSEGAQRIERLEPGSKLTQRMKNAGFLGLPFSDETVEEVKSLLEEHASGWGMKRDEDMLVLTWKGHSSVFSTAWVTK